MTLLAHVADRLKSLGLDCSVVNDAIVIPTAERPTRLRMEEGWEEAFKQYRQARSLAFDLDTRSLVHNASVEYVLVRLAPGAPLVDHHDLKDPAGNVVTIGTASMIFALAFFDSTEYGLDPFPRTHLGSWI